MYFYGFKGLYDTKKKENSPILVQFYSDKLLPKRENSESTYKFVLSELPDNFSNKLEKHSLKIDFSKLYSDKIKLFVGVISNCLPYVNLDSFYENYKNFKFTHVKKNLFNFLLFSKYAASYVSSSKENKIVFYTHDIDSTIYHELLHMASRIVYDDKTFIGFYQSSNNFNIGDGLNEGYTDLLSIRYFSSFGETPSNYELEMYISQLIELIVGKKYMEICYFNSDLYSLCEMLRVYLNSNDIILLLNSIDYILKHSKNIIFKAQVKKLYREVALLLINIALQKYYILNGENCSKEVIVTFKEKLLNLISTGYNDEINGLFALNAEDVWNINKRITIIDSKFMEQKSLKNLTKTI